MNNIVKSLIGIVSIASGLYVLFKLSISLELAVAFLSLTFGVLAIIWTLIAKYSLSPGSTLRDFTTNFLVGITFLLIYSLTTIIRQINSPIQNFVPIEYFLIAATFLLFVIAAYQILYIGKQFGFEKEAKTIKSILRTKKRR
nr:hypothetical protein [Candidatus Woesearchaeota archaeon]